jgi:hypothetical protein
MSQPVFKSRSGVKKYFENLSAALDMDENVLRKEITINHVDLSRKKIKYVSVLGNYKIHTLDLSETYVNDVSMLGGVHTLLLYETYVNDVSMLGGVNTLDLSGCPDVRDVSMLGGVHSLNISGCRNISDFSALGNVYDLNLNGCNVKNEDLVIFKNVHSLNLAYCNISDVSPLRNVHTLDLTGTEVRDVSMLGNVHSLNLSECENVEDVSQLGGVHTLNLSNCPRVRNVSMLRNVHSLDFTGTEAEESMFRDTHNIIPTTGNDNTMINQPGSQNSFRTPRARNRPVTRSRLIMELVFIGLVLLSPIIM